MKLLLILISVSTFASDPTWVKLPAGKFTIGCAPSDSCPEWQTPREVVIAGPFELMAREVTVGEFRRFVEAQAYKTVAEERGDTYTWAKPRSYRLADNLPVTYVTLRDAEAYCAWVGGRVPSETEWTYAFRAGAEREQGHLWWNTDGRYVWFRENSDARPHKVGTRLPNAWGLFDMEGNVWEWTLAPKWEKYKAMIRGGSWVTCPFIEGRPKEGGPDRGRFTRCSSDGLVHLRDDIGFRCAR